MSTAVEGETYEAPTEPTPWQGIEHPDWSALPADPYREYGVASFGDMGDLMRCSSGIGDSLQWAMDSLQTEYGDFLVFRRVPAPSAEDLFWQDLRKSMKDPEFSAGYLEVRREIAATVELVDGLHGKDCIANQQPRGHCSDPDCGCPCHLSDSLYRSS